MIALSSDDFTQAKRVIGEGHIPMASIDKLGLDDIDVIKIDVEGYDFLQSLGYKLLLEHWPDKVFHRAD